MATRLDLVWDTYISDSLKESTRVKRDKGVRRKVSGETKLPGHPFQLLNLDDDHFQKFERLTVILYDKTSPLNSVNETRRELFCQRNRAMDKLPPTKDALLQHVRRAVYQAGIWTSSTEAKPVVPFPQDFAWTKESD